MTTLSAPRQAVSVRSWTADDDEFVARLSREAFGEYGARPAQYMSSVTHRPGTRTWIAIEAGVPVGLVVLELTGSEAALLAVAVTARARARGIGGLLMQTAETHAATHGALQLSLFTAEANLAALDLFLRRGFRIVGRRPAFYARRQNACQLRKLLRVPGA